MSMDKLFTSHRSKKMLIPFLLLAMASGVAVSGTTFRTTFGDNLQSTNVEMNIDGSLDLFSTSFDLCQRIDIGSCPISFQIMEQYNQQVNNNINLGENLALEPNDSLSLSDTISPQQPSDYLIFSFDGDSYALPLSSIFPSIGCTSAYNTSIPIGAIIAAVTGFPVPSDLTMGLSLDITNDILAQFNGEGFAHAAQMNWSSAGPQFETLDFQGGTNEASLNMSMISEQSLDLALSFGLPGLGSYSFPPITLGNQNFSSASSTNVGSWYEVSTQSEYSTVGGSGWYPAGTLVTVPLANNVIQVGQGEREIFAGWQGNYTGVGQTVSFDLRGPVNETATWGRQYLLSVIQSTGGTISTNASEQWVNAGSTISIHAAADSSYDFAQWIIDGQDPSGNVSMAFVVAGPTNLSAVFRFVPSTTALTTSSASTAIPTSSPSTATSSTLTAVPSTSLLGNQSSSDFASASVIEIACIVCAISSICCAVFALRTRKERS